MNSNRLAGKRTPTPPPQVEDFPVLCFEDGVTMWNAERLRAVKREEPREAERICETIDILGRRSRQAQGINAVLTSAARLLDAPTNRLYLLVEDGRGVGILKLGAKKLYISMPPPRVLRQALQTNSGRSTATGGGNTSTDQLSYSGDHIVEMEPECVLDFYVCEEVQRSGKGKELYECALVVEGLRPEQLAIDRPSAKFLSFMERHYGLKDYTPQQNNFVVFHRYFERRPSRPLSNGAKSPTPNNRSTANSSAVASRLDGDEDGIGGEEDGNHGGHVESQRREENEAHMLSRQRPAQPVDTRGSGASSGASRGSGAGEEDSTGRNRYRRYGGTGSKGYNIISGLPF